MAGKLYPPFRFQAVEADLFRGGLPKPRNYRFLLRLNARTIVSLTPQPPPSSMHQFALRNNIQLVHIKVDKPKGSVPLTYAKVGTLLNTVIDPNNLPLFIHCLDGVIVTGVVIMCLRKLQCWSIPSATIEYTRFIREGVIGSDEAEFVDKFQYDFEIGRSLPKWLWNGHPTFRKHPSLRVRLPPPIISSNEESGTSTSTGIAKTGTGDDMRKRVNAELSMEKPIIAGTNDGRVRGRNTLPDDEEGDMSRTLQALALEVPAYSPRLS
ncbi:hypothetical protein SeMB42_g00502 [Synchytrium endobioticum]|uniref:Tyrosine specific protein phosphatases domain-containing protein n=1 Tax=Synchytrium endobioticum TaxID=286115 RepID=A0A507DR80_9FUNG|nr:hypothetical protein SeLEV6574_g00070 [Synchytrium endobioticum]TPX53961.1 hypothetical protein SeMB42_g00502 [Synchytrium endobioticum]